jgi:hypothetical protein
MMIDGVRRPRSVESERRWRVRLEFRDGNAYVLDYGD